MKDRVTIDGVVYSQVVKMSDDMVIVRTENAGVHYGQLAEKDGNEVVLENSRRLWYWSGAASLSQLAMEGVKSPSSCKFTVAVPTITLLGCIEIIPCTEAACNIINDVEEWRND